MGSLCLPVARGNLEDKPWWKHFAEMIEARSSRLKTWASSVSTNCGTLTTLENNVAESRRLKRSEPELPPLGERRLGTREARRVISGASDITWLAC